MIYGKVLKEDNKNEKFYILLDKEEKLNKIKIIKGLNVYDKLNPYYKKVNKCFTFFCLKNLYFRFLRNKKIYICEIEILDDSLITVYCDGYDTDKFILKNKILIKDFDKWKDKEFCYRALDNNPLLIKYSIKSIFLCNFAVSKDAKSLKYIRDLQTYELLEISNFKGDSLKYVKKELQTYQLCEKAVKVSGYNISYVRNDLLDYNLCIISINKNRGMLRYIKKDLQDYELCKLALSYNVDDLEYVREDIQDYELCLYAIENSYNGKNIKYVRDDLLDENLCEISINKYGKDNLKYVRDDLKTYKICYDSIKFIGNTNLKYVKKDLQDNALCEMAISKNKNSFRYIRKDLQDYNLCKLSIKDRKNLNFIRKDLLDKELFKMIIDRCLK